VTLYSDILQRVLVTVAMIAVFRAGLYIPLPGIDASLVPVASAFSEGAVQ
jgi:preprotein translocase subunit SecY